MITVTTGPGRIGAGVGDRAGGGGVDYIIPIITEEGITDTVIITVVITVVFTAAEEAAVFTEVVVVVEAAVTGEGVEGAVVVFMGDRWFAPRPSVGVERLNRRAKGPIIKSLVPRLERARPHPGPLLEERENRRQMA
jgi:hypothetical protein